MKKTSKDVGVQIEQKLIARTEVSHRLDALSTEIAQATSQQREKEALAKDVRSQLEVFQKEKGIEQSARRTDLSNVGRHCIDLAKQFSNVALSDQEKEKFESLEKQMLAVDAELAEANATLHKLNSEEADLLAQLLDPSTAVEETLLFQKKLNEAEHKVAGLREQIMLHLQVIHDANSGLPTGLSELQTKREDILAEIAIGSATVNDLEDIDSRIGASKVIVSEASKAAKATTECAEQTITGLRRKLAQAEDELNVLSLRGRAVISRYLLIEAEKTGAEYAELATALVGSFRRVVALGRIMNSKGFPSIGEDNIWPFTIPVFALKAHDSQLVPEWFFDNQPIERRLRTGESDIEAEKERIAGLGIAL